MSKNVVYNIPDVEDLQSIVEGNGERQLLVVCENSNYSDEDHTTLQKLIGAIKHDFEKDIFLAFVNHKHKIHLSSLNLSIKKVICFGVKPEEIGLNINGVMYTILDFENLQFLFSDSIQEINASPTKKSTLWQQLQQMFLK